VDQQIFFLFILYWPRNCGSWLCIYMSAWSIWQLVTKHVQALWVESQLILVVIPNADRHNWIFFNLTNVILIEILHIQTADQIYRW